MTGDMFVQHHRGQKLQEYILGRGGGTLRLIVTGTKVCAQITRDLAS